jgi:hypothetical protein
MASRNIKSIRDSHPGKADTEAAKAFAEESGYLAIVRYKNSKTSSDFTDIGACNTEAEIRGYLSSPYCHNAEIIYDRRSSVFQLNAEHILKGTCEKCGARATDETLQIGAGNDFYFCPKCGLLFCDSCYARLPVTSSPGYGTCPKCEVQVKRAIPSFFVTASASLSPSSRSLQSTHTTQPQTRATAQTRRWWEVWK